VFLAAPNVYYDNNIDEERVTFNISNEDQIQLSFVTEASEHYVSNCDVLIKDVIFN